MDPDEYIAQLSDKERVAYLIAVRMLGSSFSLEKSIGFIQKNENEKKEKK
jgi:hypothetical protein